MNSPFLYSFIFGIGGEKTKIIEQNGNKGRNITH